MTLATRSLSQCEEVIDRGLATFVEVGLALMEIRDSRLYLETHSTFEVYCKERWQFSDRHARRLIEASEVIGALESGPIGPPNEAQARELAPLKDEPEKMAEAWEEAVKESNGKPTAVHVANAVNKVTHVHYCRAPGCTDSFTSPTKHCRDCDQHYSDSHECSGPKVSEQKNPALYTSESEDWHTPRDIIVRVENTFGGAIDLDPCSNLGKPNVPSVSRFTIDEDGLAQEWFGRVYMNPPYGDVLGKWIEKLVKEFNRERVIEAVALVPSRTDTRWFRSLRAFPRCFIFGRLKFSESGNSAPFPSMAVYLGSKTGRFVKAFSPIGDVFGVVE